MKILLVEDCRFMARAIKQLLENEDHQVQWIVGLRHRADNQCHEIVGLNQDGQSQVSISPLDYDLAIVDGQLEGDLDGPQVVQCLRLANGKLPILAISTEEKLNADMMQHGAAFSLRKPCFFTALHSGVLKVRQVRRLKAIKRLALKHMEANLSSDDYKTARKAADLFVMPYLKEEA